VGGADALSAGQLCVVLRSFGNAEIAKAVRFLADYDPVRHIVVAVDPNRDPVDTPLRLSVRSWPITVAAFHAEPYGWARSLNTALGILPLLTEPALVWTLSNEVNVTPAQLDAMITAASHEDAICGFATFADRAEPSYRVPRNTCCVWRRDVLSDLNGFYEGGDSTGGMEDYELILRAHEQTGRLPTLAATDVSLSIRPETDMDAKLALEASAMSAAEALHSPATVAAVRRHLRLL